MGFLLFKIIFFLVLISNIFTFHSEDEVLGFPDHPYNGKMHSGYLTLMTLEKNFTIFYLRVRIILQMPLSFYGLTEDLVAEV